MSNKRIDLTQFEEMEDARPWHASWYPAEEGVEPDFLIDGGADGYKVRIVDTQGGVTLAYIANGNETLANQIAKLPDLIAELKRCYEELDFLKANVLTDEDYWIATCKPDGEGQCTMMIEGYQELMHLVKEGKIEIPEYSHGYDELLLYECECGVTHEQWLESKN